jgi:LruC domain-containing protein
MKKSLLIIILFYMTITNLNAEGFDTCPSKAFLIQGTNSTVYGVNLVSGSYDNFADDVGPADKFNGVGFSVHDRYIYGWDYNRGNVGRLGKDYQLEPINAEGFPEINFYVGDVSVFENTYYVYKKGIDYGLYSVSLDTGSSDYLKAKKIINGSELSINIFDFAFHPNKNNELGIDKNIAFSVDNKGDLHKINARTGDSQNIGNTGVFGTFGAVYFDVEGNFYISRNSDGHIFMVNINNPVDTVLFAYGPNSSNNDGARCAIAPIIDESEEPTVDFDDAPDSYGSKLSDRARHTKGSLYFGNGVTAEHQPKAIDDDDGVQFVTNIETGKDTLVKFIVSRDSYVNAWIDWDKNNIFEDNEKIISEHFSMEGENRLLIEVPVSAIDGSTWARFRVSNQPNIGAIGGVDNGEVEDINITIVNTGISETITSWKTVAFEDLWPEKGDYDFNDVVVKYKLIKSQLDNEIVKYKIKGYLMAVGASYHNGFAFKFKGIKRSDVEENLMRYEIKNKQLLTSPLEENMYEAIVIIFKDTREVAPVIDGCKYFRTEKINKCILEDVISFEVTLPLREGINTIGYNEEIMPFIFGVNGFDHGSYVDKDNARAWEVHLKNKEPTEAFDRSYFDNGDDQSSSKGNYQTDTGLPWALIIGENWYHPKENIDITKAYSEFKSFAESSGDKNPTWFNNPVIKNAIQN